jgi:hypothetical protein
MQIFGIQINSRDEKQKTLKGVIEALSITQEEKDIYIISLDILSDRDFNLFFEKIMQQIPHWTLQKEYRIAPLTSNII